MRIKPEKIVEAEVLAMCKILELDVDVIDSKATYSENLKQYRKSNSAPEGFPDLVGNDSRGRAIFIELKAAGKLKQLRRSQVDFLQRKANLGCFAVAVDSAQMLHDLYLRWLSGTHSTELLQQILQKNLKSPASNFA